jgi:hypothetical protein
VSARIPQPGTVLRGGEGAAVVVPSGTSPLDGLNAILDAEYGGEPFAADNPAIVAALPKVRVETWRSCTKAWREGEGVDDDWCDDWWAPDGDGARQITVARYDGRPYALGDAAVAALGDAS